MLVRVCRLSWSRQRLVYIQKSFSTSGSHAEETGSRVENYDIIIAGGGMVGTTLACSLGIDIYNF